MRESVLADDPFVFAFAEDLVNRRLIEELSVYAEKQQVLELQLDAMAIKIQDRKKQDVLVRTFGSEVRHRV